MQTETPATLALRGALRAGARGNCGRSALDAHLGLDDAGPVEGQHGCIVEPRQHEHREEDRHGEANSGHPEQHEVLEHEMESRERDPHSNRADDVQEEHTPIALDVCRFGVAINIYMHGNLPFLMVKSDVGRGNLA